MSEHSSGQESKGREVASQQELKDAFGVVQWSIGIEPGSPPADILDPDWTGLLDENTEVSTTLTGGFSLNMTQIEDSAYIIITGRTPDSEVLQENQLQITRNLDGSFKVLRYPQCASSYATWEELIAANNPVEHRARDEGELDPDLKIDELSKLDLLDMEAVVNVLRDKMVELDTREAVYGTPSDSVDVEDLAYFIDSVRTAKAHLQ